MGGLIKSVYKGEAKNIDKRVIKGRGLNNRCSKIPLFRIGVLLTNNKRGKRGTLIIGRGGGFKWVPIGNKKQHKSMTNLLPSLLPFKICLTDEST